MIYNHILNTTLLGIYGHFKIGITYFYFMNFLRKENKYY